MWAEGMGVGAVQAGSPYHRFCGLEARGTTPEALLGWASVRALYRLEAHTTGFCGFEGGRSMMGDINKPVQEGFGMRIFSGILVALMFAPLVVAEAPRVLTDDDLGGEPELMVRRYLDALADEAFAARKERYEALETEEDVAAYQEAGHDFFVDALGGWPDRTPLNAQVLGGGEGVGFRYEKIMYESLPNYFVTATLFLPTSDGPYPGVLVPCGHSNNGKASEVYQRACILLARHGMAALIYDPIGQGERYHFFNDDKKPLFGTTLHHTTMGVGCILTGTNIARYRIWDGMRGLDYLASRDDIDPDRLACTGNSGGGTLTSYIMALDDRVTVAAPSCYLTTFEKLLDTIGPQDAEQDIFGQIAYGLDHADYIHLRAPKPTLMCAATQDFFDIEGTWETFREAKRLYTRLGFPERVSLAEVDEKHGFSQGLREAMVSWMSRWLLEEDVNVEEPAFDVVPEADVICSPEGQVIWMEGARSLFDLSVALSDKLAEERAPLWEDPDVDALRAQVRELIAYPGGDEISVPEAESRGTVEHDGVTWERIVLKPEPGILLPALLAIPEGEVKGAAVLASGRGMREILSHSPAAKYLSQGDAALLVDVRGVGETETVDSPKGWGMYVGEAWRDYFRAYLLGKSFVGMRAYDLSAAGRYLADRFPDKPVRLVARYDCTVPAQHAAALHPGLFESVFLQEGIPSWTAVVEEPRARRQLVNTVHGALELYDLPDLVSLAGPTEIQTESMTVPSF
jgi:dienelactone hydrolase